MNTIRVRFSLITKVNKYYIKKYIFQYKIKLFIG